jgi:hypothetical protein
LLKRGANIDVAAIYGATPLHYAVERGNANLAKLLLAHKADPNAIITIGITTPLHIAARSGNTDVVKLLLADKRTNITIQNSDGKTASEVATDPTITSLINKSHTQSIKQGANKLSTLPEQDKAVEKLKKLRLQRDANALSKEQPARRPGVGVQLPSLQRLQYSINQYNVGVGVLGDLFTSYNPVRNPSTASTTKGTSRI